MEEEKRREEGAQYLLCNLKMFPIFIVFSFFHSAFPNEKQSQTLLTSFLFQSNIPVWHLFCWEGPALLSREPAEMSSFHCLLILVAQMWTLFRGISCPPTPPSLPLAESYYTNRCTSGIIIRITIHWTSKGSELEWLCVRLVLLLGPELRTEMPWNDTAI